MPLTRGIKVSADGTPKPLPIPQGQGKKFMKMIEPERTLILDAGVFDYLWRVMEEKHRQAHDRPGRPLEHLDLVQRGLEAFQRAAAPPTERSSAPVNGQRPKRAIKRR